MSPRGDSTEQELALSLVEGPPSLPHIRLKNLVVHVYGDTRACGPVHVFGSVKDKPPVSADARIVHFVLTEFKSVRVPTFRLFSCSSPAPSKIFSTCTPSGST